MLGGGNFTSQNKILPGAYINFVSAVKAVANISNRGIVAIGVSLDWGIDSAVFTVTNEEFMKNSLKLFGYEYTANELKSLRDLFKHAKKVLFYRLNTGKKATNTYADAKYSGTKGNDINIVISANVDVPSKFDVKTFFGTILVSEQIGVANAAELVNNDYVTWKSAASLAITPGTKLAGGTNEAVTGTQHTAFLTAIESFGFNILACTATEPNTKVLYTAFTSRMRNQAGVKFQTVMFDESANYEGIISVKNSAELVPWVAGAEASCAINGTCTNMIYDGEYDIVTNYTQSQLEDNIKTGRLTFHRVGEDFRVLTDINSLTEVTADKGVDFKSNQTIRVLDQIGNDIAALFNSKYLGKIQNDESGRISLWSDLVTYFKELERMRAIEAFDPADVTVDKGSDKKSVVIYSSVTPTNCMEKLYMTVVVE